MLWTIRNAQLDAFKEARTREFETRAIAYLRREYPERCKDLDDEALRETVKTALAKGEPYQYKSAQSVYSWLDLMYLLGFEFDRDPATDWVQELLTDFELGPETRLTLLEERARARLGRKRINGVPP